MTIQNSVQALPGPLVDILDPIISVEGLWQSFGANHILCGIDLEIHSGDVILLRGANGSGKTTLLNVLTANFKPDKGKIALKSSSDSITFSFPTPLREKMSLFSKFTPEGFARRGVGRSWQDIRLFCELTVKENLKVGSRRVWGEDPISPIFMRGVVKRREAELDRQVDRTLAEFELAPLAHQNTMELSLGDAKRAAIARALRAEANILFLDEPFSGLDEASARRAVDLLRTLVVDHEKTLVLIEHSFHIARVLEFATRVWTMRSGSLIEQTPAEVRKELEVVRHDSVDVWLQALLTDGWTQSAHQLSQDARLTRLSRNLAATDFSVSTPEPPVLEVKGLTVRREGHVVLGRHGATSIEDGVSFLLRKGEIAILRAPNGWGKTSLADSILGLLPESTGEILHHGEPIGSLPAWERARRGIVLLQDRENIFVSMTPREIMALRNSEGISTVETALRDRPLDQMSGGERQRVALASCLGVRSSDLLILDEPFNMVDAAGVSGLYQELANRPNAAVLLLLPAQAS